MAATPYKLEASFVDANGNPVHTANLSASDVANAFVTNDRDGLTFIDLPKDVGPVYLGDLFASADGVDTKQLELWVGGTMSRHVFRTAKLASAANVKRVPQVGFKPGARVQFRQIA